MSLQRVQYLKSTGKISPSELVIAIYCTCRRLFLGAPSSTQFCRSTNIQPLGKANWKVLDDQTVIKASFTSCECQL